MLFRISYLYSYIKIGIYTVQYHPICLLRNPICFTTTKILNYSTQTKKKASKFRRFCENVYVKVSLYNYCFFQYYTYFCQRITYSNNKRVYLIDLKSI